MAIDNKAAELLSAPAGKIIQISFFQERLNGQTRRLAHVAGDGPHEMILLAEQAHVADRIEQAMSLIESAYALYDQCLGKAERVASAGNTSAPDAPRNRTIAARWQTGPNRPAPRRD